MPSLAACHSDASMSSGGRSTPGFSSVAAATSARQINASSTVVRPAVAGSLTSVRNSLL